MRKAPGAMDLYPMQMARIAADLGETLRFYSRLPVPAMPADAGGYDPPDIDRIAYAVPLAGALIGLIGAAMLFGAGALGLTPFLGAVLAVAAMVLVTGAFHEDGLADTADGLGGGTVARRLEIMRDSRIGTFGASALMLALLLRVGALEALQGHAGILRTALALMAGAAVSRTAGLLLLRALPPARTDGSAFVVGRPSADGALASAVSAAAVVALLLVPGFGVGATFAGLVAVLAVVLLMTHRAARLFGGHTGDVAGATQQLSEIAFLLAVLLFTRAP